jgi:hypothetical protein
MTSSAHQSGFFAWQQGVPPWERGVAQLLRWASSRIRVIHCCTPLNLGAELFALQDAFDRGQPRLPRFRYEPAGTADVSERLRRAADELQPLGPVAELYAGRAVELALENAICRNAGTGGLQPLARSRYGRRDPFDEQADHLSDQWLAAPRLHEVPDHTTISDDEGDPNSLVSRLRQAVGKWRLPVRVLTSDRMAALAATGEGVIYVATGKRLSDRTVERTVLHEVQGHALPRHRAASAALGIFAIGTAHGSDDQEGRALAFEDAASLLGPSRRLELARRHLAGRAVEGGADFVATTRLLIHDAGAATATALRIAARAHRGGGLARELVYLPALLRIRDAWQRDPTIDAVLGSGQVSPSAAATLAPWIDGESAVAQ